MITYRDIESLTHNADFGGFGYLGHSMRTHDADVALATAANDLGLTLAQVFEWANSKPGRWFGDSMTFHNGQATVAQFTNTLVAAS